MPSVDRSACEQWASAEFVVALPHLDTVRAELSLLPQPVMAVEEQDEALGLALIKISNVAEVADRITRQVGVGERCPYRGGSRRDEYPIERIIRAIRENCRRRNGGWVPVMGKNRTLDGVHTAQHVGIGSDGYPTRSPAVDLPTNGTTNWASVGVLDTGLWPHPQLNGRYLTDEAHVLIESTEWHWYLAGHAIFVAGVILQGAPNARLHVRRVLDDRNGTALAWDVAKEMVRLAKSVSVLSLSFCCFTDDNEPPLVLSRAVERIATETVIVAAAGNHGGIEPGESDCTPSSPRSPMWPAAFDQVVAVGAHDDKGKKAYFSPDAAWVNLTARGEDVVSLYLDCTVKFEDRHCAAAPHDTRFDGYARWKGTSFAAAAVSGAIARRINPEKTARQALQDVLHLPRGNPEGIWRYQPTNGPCDAAAQTGAGAYRGG
jgi:Subtilase family